MLSESVMLGGLSLTQLSVLVILTPQTVEFILIVIFTSCYES